MSGKVYKPLPISDAASAKERQAILLAMVMPKNSSFPSLEQIAQDYLKWSNETKPTNTWTFKAGNTTYVGYLKPASFGMTTSTVASDNVVFEIHLANHDLAMFPVDEAPWKRFTYTYDYPDFSDLEPGDEIDVDMDKPRKILSEVSRVVGPLSIHGGRQPEMYAVGARYQYSLIDGEGNVLTRFAWKQIFQFDTAVLEGQ